MSEALGIKSLIHSNVCVVNLRFRSCSVRFIYSFPCYCGVYPCARQHRDIDSKLIIISKTGQSQYHTEGNCHVVRINV